MKDMGYELYDYVKFKTKEKNIIGYVVSKYFNGEGVIHFYDIYSEIEEAYINHVPESELHLLAKSNSMACKALKLAVNVHKNQVDLVGEPYINHIVAVGEKVKKFKDDDLLTVAYLHDILEDTYITEDILRCIFPDDIVDAVRSITKSDKYQPYEEYIQIVKLNELSRIVKLADLEHNLVLSRIKDYTSKDLLRIKKYRKAVKELSNL
ncbi:HD domain-containing protein [Vagococcus zengguangii]|uniref:Bifunctional (P)ppGpp synthetase/guanosine-3',5'-bis(Diphosphate) 3'-pyrophosphohydrolase n=1 Tax=Vagococcus zengguangii TaxID=2571750 RepID=A0A4D7CST5_9ENTE|nr:HD domain-containing protein [Vagococcus zengguangii]QCI85546.1 bifunctional (p)ppGpp synthetase/guanosine-3',5'-bis(diphosphate) 3'-pyrophosphohydrolase [Vagococcus zengguangii]TLG80092.1 bifunctional (p)ppGpp synthetase/guanosine-3',5'-bis(diphosphate) 3'-pyrophosphohydrolase [Vagococcus zengguangii]